MKQLKLILISSLFLCFKPMAMNNYDDATSVIGNIEEIEYSADKKSCLVKLSEIAKKHV